MRAFVKCRRFILLGLGVLVGIGMMLFTNEPASSWPAASLEGRQESCLSYHTNTGPWVDEGKLIIDIIDAKTGESFRLSDGSYVIPVKQGTERRVRAVFGVKPEVQYPPDMVGWLYVDPEELTSAPEASIKFARRWNVNRSFCGKRLVEKFEGYPGDKLAQITKTISPGENATDREIRLQVLFKSLAR